MPRHDLKGTECGKRKEFFWTSITAMEEDFRIWNSTNCPLCQGEVPNCKVEIDYSDWQSCGIQANLASPFVYFRNDRGHIIPQTHQGEKAPYGYYQEDAHTLHEVKRLESVISRQADAEAKNKFERADAVRMYTDRLEKDLADADIKRTLGTVQGGGVEVKDKGQQYVEDYIRTKREERQAKARRTIGTVNAKIAVLHESESTRKKRLEEALASDNG